MEVNRLLGTELAYELRIRGIPIPEKVADRRIALREVLRQEKENGTSTEININLDFEEEMKICRKKTKELGEAIEDFDPENAENDFRRIYSRLAHLNQRIERISGEEQEEEDERKELVDQIRNLYATLNVAYEDGSTTRSRPQMVRRIENEVSEIQNMSILDMPNPLLPDTSISRKVPTHSVSLPTPALEMDLLHLGDDEWPRSRQHTSTAGPSTTRETPSAIRNYPSPHIHRSLPNNLPRSVQFSQSNMLPFQHSTYDSLNMPSIRRVDATHEAFSTNPPNPIRRTPVVNFSEVTQPPNSWQDRRNESDLQIEERYPDRTTLAVAGSHSNPMVNSTYQDQRYLDDYSVRRAEPVHNVGAQPFRDLPVSHYPILENKPPHYFDISKWKVTYDGDSSVTGFLERVEELRRSRGVSKEQLLQSAPELFTKKALTWFRTQYISSWDHLVQRLRDDFLPYDYEYELWDEIRKRTQGAREKTVMYVAAMENLFNKLGTSKPSEEIRIKTIRRNLLPLIQSQIALCHITTINDLVRVSRSVEETAQRVQSFCPPPANYRQLLEPELAYYKPPGHYPPQVSEVSSIVSPPKRSISATPTIETLSSPENLSKCFNCLQTGHRFKKCPAPRKRFFCFRCGQENVTSKTCPKCVPKN